MDDLIAFLMARLDEEEHVARMAAEDASAGENWRVEARYPNSGSAGIVGEHGEKIVSDEGFPSQMEAAHIARHDPARALREVAAKRAILAWYADSVDASATFREKLGTGTHMAVAAESYLNVIRGCAAIWSEHPDYQASWAPPAA